MTQVNMLEAKTDLSRLVRLLETHQEETVWIARHGQPIVEMKLIQKPKATGRIGIAAGKFRIPSDFDRWDSEVTEMFGDIE